MYTQSLKACNLWQKSLPSATSFTNHTCSYTCLNHTNVLFLKTHKCGTGTITRILMKFGLQHHLNFMIPDDGAYFLPFSESVLRNTTRTPDDLYNLMPYHMRYSPQMKRLMYPDTRTVTILRNPATRFESEYSYNKMYLFGDKLTFDEFMKSPPRAFSHVIPKTFASVGYNQMSVDLGFDREYGDNETAIRVFVDYIDREFDLVMITEHEDVSLVLLANLMGWPLEYVRYLRIHVRAEDAKYELSESDMLTLMRLNYADSMLYAYFYRKFIQRVVSYGVERMNQDLRRLSRMNEELVERCVAKQKVSKGKVTIEYENKNGTDEECVYWSRDSNTVLSEIKNAQERRLEQRVI